jgi:hypothetical protein
MMKIRRGILVPPTLVQEQPLENSRNFHQLVASNTLNPKKIRKSVTSRLYTFENLKIK